MTSLADHHQLMRQDQTFNWLPHLFEKWHGDPSRLRDLNQRAQDHFAQRKGGPR